MVSCLAGLVIAFNQFGVEEDVLGHGVLRSSLLCILMIFLRSKSACVDVDQLGTGLLSLVFCLWFRAWKSVFKSSE